MHHIAFRWEFELVHPFRLEWCAYLLTKSWSNVPCSPFSLNMTEVLPCQMVYFSWCSSDHINVSNTSLRRVFLLRHSWWCLPNFLDHTMVSFFSTFGFFQRLWMFQIYINDTSCSHWTSLSFKWQLFYYYRVKCLLFDLAVCRQWFNHLDFLKRLWSPPHFHQSLTVLLYQHFAPRINRFNTACPLQTLKLNLLVCLLC